MIKFGGLRAKICSYLIVKGCKDKKQKVNCVL